MAARDEVLARFPDLDPATLRISSPVTTNYNCIAYAVGDTTRWWEPAPMTFWPTGVMRVYSLTAYQRAFETVGYTLCADGDHDPALEKVALFHKDQSPEHAARQLRNGLWTSKLGSWYDIHHDLEGMVGAVYGEIAFFMSRPWII